MSIITSCFTLQRTISRCSIFFSCRKYLLRIFYSDLHSLSVPSPNSVPGTPTPITTTTIKTKMDEETMIIELDSLPLPSTAHTPKSPKFSLDDTTTTTHLHAAVSRLMFSWCFTESCMMFFLLILQAFGIFSARRVFFFHFRCSIYYYFFLTFLFFFFSNPPVPDF